VALQAFVPIIIIMPFTMTAQGIPIAIIAFMASQRSFIIAMSVPSIGMHLSIMPSLPSSHVILHIMGIIIGMLIIIGIMPPPIIGPMPAIGIGIMAPPPMAFGIPPIGMFIGMLIGMLIGMFGMPIGMFIIIGCIGCIGCIELMAGIIGASFGLAGPVRGGALARGGAAAVYGATA
jgi:hypothetical protein